ncbi:MAG: tetratricopeptide repeat protein [Rhodothermaceae bacterium]|nr:tetratricopeptide repeat protein [Rhodothermaceae bacterium]
MKPSHVNSLLLAALLLFAIVYWNARSTSSPTQAAASVSSSPASATMQSQGAIASEHLTIDVLKARVQEAPNDTSLINHLAQVLHDDSRYEEAAVYYNQFLALAPRNVQGWLDLANVYAALQDWDNALEASQSLLDFVPHHPSAMYNMGAIHANLSNLEEATFWWTQVRDQNEDADLAQQAEQNLLRIQPTPSF